MAPKTWTTPEQHAWLTARMNQFISRQAEHKLHLFWPAMNEGYFRVWPEHVQLGLPLPTDPLARALTPEENTTLGVAVKAKKGQLENWFRYQRNKLARAGKKDNVGGAPIKGSIAANIQAMFNLTHSKRTRVHQPVEIFQKRNGALIQAALTAEGYDDITDEADAPDDFTDEAAGTPAAVEKSAKALRMRVRTRVVAALWQEADDKEKAAVQEVIEKEKLALRTKELNAEGASKTTSNYQDAIDALDTVFSDIHQAVFEAAGWVGMTMLGGPNPRLPNGEMSMKIICFGETPAGHDFEQSCVNFDENVAVPFEQFAQMCFTAEQCNSRAFLTVDPTTLKDAPRLHRAEPIVVAPPPAKKGKKPKAPKNKRKQKQSAPLVEDSDHVEDSDCDSGRPSSPLSTSSPVSVSVENDGVPVPDIALPTDEPNSAMLESSDCPASAGDAAGSFGGDDGFDNDNDSGAMDLGNDDNDSGIWPPGMTAPLSPAAAAVLARRERGGTAAGATMAIDPVLVAMSASPVQIPPVLEAPSPFTTTVPNPQSEYPRPRPAYRNVPPLTNVNGFNFPASAPPASNVAGATSPYKPSVLFGAFHGSSSTPRVPAAYIRPQVTPAQVHIAQTGPTKAARFMSSLIGKLDAPTTLSPIVTSTPLPIMGTPHSPAPAPTVSTIAGAPLIAVNTPSPIARSIPTTPAPTPSVPTPFFAPESRPPTKLSAAPVKRANVAPKKTAAKADSKKGSAAKGATRENAVEVAHKAAVVADTVKRARGRPRKVAAPAPAPDDTVALGEITNASGSSPPILISSISNNTMVTDRRVRAMAKAREEAKEVLAREVEAAARQEEVDRGWHERNGVNGERIVALTTGRARRPTKNFDGTSAKLPTKGGGLSAVNAAAAAADANTLAQLQNGKRRASTQATTTSKKSKK
ncbi:hypothetical protein C8R46DRAFT_1232033 [Mycena filopes]|nr:hypothetical protein C8R46DRAFT_1232033 [Mycena filopes]